jgi:hypothetical protein
MFGCRRRRHLAQATRHLLYDVEYGFAERANQLLRVDRSDATDHAGAEVLLDAFNCGRRGRLEEGGAELHAMGTVVDPGSAGLNELTGRNHCSMADERNQIALASGLDAQHTKSVLGV